MRSQASASQSAPNVRGKKRLMRRSSLRRRTAVATVALVILSGCGSGDGPAAARPNIIVYMVDTLRARELGCYGSEITQTPSLDAFAADAVLFESARTPAPYTRPAVASFITGLTPAVHGIESALAQLSDAHADITLLPEILQEQGYFTAALIANPNVDAIFGFDRGFDHYKTLYPERASRDRVTSGEMVSTASVVVDEVRQFIGSAPNDRPYFLFVLSIDPHEPYRPPEPYLTMYDPDAASSRAGEINYIQAVQRILAAGGTVSPEPMLALYRGEVTYSDAEFGALLDWLGENDALDETLIVFTADHGEAFIEHGERGHGQGIYDEAVHIPMILRYPDSFPAGTRRGEHVDLMDLTATLALASGADLPDYWSGRNLAQPVIDAPIFTMSHAHFGASYTGVVDKDHKLIWNELRDLLEFYDIANDPLEQVPLGAVEHASILKSLTMSLNKFRRQSASLRARLIGEQSSIGQEDVPETIRRQLKSLGYVE
jgi:choline-sulfatase